MSIKVMGQVWDLALPHNKLLVLLAMADHADHDGKHVRPSLELIAWKTGYEERQVRRIVRTLEQDGLLQRECTGGGRRKANEYSIHLENGVKKSPFARNPDIMTVNYEKPGHYDRESEINPDIMTEFAEETRTFEHQNPDIAMSPEPSLEPKTQEREDPPLSPQGDPPATKRALAPRKPVGVHRCPSDYEPSPAVRAWAAAKYPHIGFDDALEAMRDWTFKDPRSDWDAVLRTWIRNEAKQTPRASPAYTRRMSRDEARAIADAQSNKDLEDLVHGRNTFDSPWNPVRRDGADVPSSVGRERQSGLRLGAG